MVNVTERAKEKLHILRDAELEEATGGLRLETMPSGQIGVVPDRERADDQVVEHQGAVVLLIGQEIARTLGDTTIDYEGDRERFVITKG